MITHSINKLFIIKTMNATNDIAQISIDENYITNLEQQTC